MAKEIDKTDQAELASVSSDSAPADGAVSEGIDAAPKRRRGRPRKTEAASTEDVAEDKPKRRGRPRKKVEVSSEAELSSDASTEAQDTAEPEEQPKPKRRGRPRKKVEETDQTTPSEPSAQEQEVSEVEEQPKPKRRGRPRKKVEEAESAESKDSPEDSTSVADVTNSEDTSVESVSENIASSMSEQQDDINDASDSDTDNDESQADESSDSPLSGLRRRRVGGVRRTIAEADADDQSEQPVSDDAPRRVRRTRRVATEEELRAAKAEVDEAKRLASLSDEDEVEIVVIEQDDDTQQDSEPEEIIEVEETKPEKVKRKKANEPTLSMEELSSWKVAELREKAVELELDPTGIRKAELIELVYEESAKREGYKSFSGIFDPSQDGFGFIRSENYISSKEDVFVAKHLIRKFGLRAGDYVEGTTQPPRAHNQLPQLLSVDSINGLDPDEARKRPRFKYLTPVYPQEQLVMEVNKNSLTGRAIDIVAPIGKGQRGLIVSPPKAGKTTILKKICESIAVNNPEVHLICLLIDERPEEVTDMRRSIAGEVVASTFDMPPENHTQISELVMERAKRLVEQGEDVVVVLDSITRLARAYNLALPASGRILSGGFDSAALYPPKRFLGAARNIEGGGSLTILASALIDTGSKMDEVIFEEFKGTGNMELKLDRDLSNKRIYPAIDPIASGTRNEDLLVDEITRQCMWGLRRTLANINNIERSQTMLIKGLKSTENNREFLVRAAKKANKPEYADLDKTE